MLRQLHVPPHIPGAAYVYSNAGYILLAHIVGLRSGVEFPRFVQERLFRPHGLAEMQYLADAETFSAQGSLMGPRLPLSVGDGGLWCTADNFARWLHLMNVDVFGTADFVATAGRLSDGTPVDYGWGIGLRQRAGKQLFLHGGSWSGARARTVRMPDPGIGLVAFAATEGGDALTALVDDLVDEMLEALQ
jgi:CubicO group peptidase (beta-lactamase class C family)